MSSDTDDPLAKYVLAWQSARAGGRNPTAEELCADAPHMARRLAARLAVIMEVDQNQATELPHVTVPPDVEVSRFVDMNNPYPAKVGDYKLLDLLGQGGMGAVFRAEDERLGRRVALKLILPMFASSQKAKARFLREARSQAGIDHDNVTAIYQTGETPDGMLYIAMPMLQGESLRQRLVEDEPMPLPLALEIGRQLCEGLAAAHARGVVHRDMKPGNVWLEGDADGDTVRFRRAKILDFGLARMDDAMNALATGTGEIMGTPAYMAPEQAKGDKVDERADLFALGVMMYEMVTGKKPFEAPTAVAVMVNIATVVPPAPNVVNPDVPRPVSEMIERMLAKTPADRPASARAVADEIVQLMADYNLGGPPKTFPSAERGGERPPATATRADSRLIEVSAVPGMWQPTPEPPMPRAGTGSRMAFDPQPPPAGGGMKWVVILGGLAALLAPIGYFVLTSGPKSDPPAGKGGEVVGRTGTSDPAVPATELPAVTVKVNVPTATVLPQGRGVMMRPTGGNGTFVFNPAPAAKFVVRVEADGYESREVSLDTGKATEYSVTLVPRTMRVVIRPHPPGTKVTFVGEPGAPAVAGRPGEYVVPRRPTSMTVSVPGFQPTTVVAVVPAAGQEETLLDLTLVPVLPAKYTDTTGITYRLIPAGTFPMRVQDEITLDPKAVPANPPTRRTTLSRPFYLSETEVTVGQFRAFTTAAGQKTMAELSVKGGTGYDPLAPRLFLRDPKWNWQNPGFPQTNDHPVVDVTWMDAKAFCDWLSQTGGKTCRLPTEAEWEYAATAGKGFIPELTAEDKLADVANVLDQSNRKQLLKDNPMFALKMNWYPFLDGHAFTAPVGSFAPNPFGLKDMLGNVREWCKDAYAPLAQTPATDPLPTRLDEDQTRVARGGSFLSDRPLWLTGRSRLSASEFGIDVGFRVVVEVPDGADAK